VGDDFVPEADAEEQAEPVTPEEEPGPPLADGVVPIEAPEADVLEQAVEVPDEDDDEPR
jgi:hypothetical protein